MHHKSVYLQIQIINLWQRNQKVILQLLSLLKAPGPHTTLLHGQECVYGSLRKDLATPSCMPLMQMVRA